MIELVVYVLAGFLIGFAATMAGIGGGAFMVPFFYFLGYEINNAVGTSKFVIVFISLFGTLNYIRLKKVPITQGLYILAGMMPASYLGAYLTAFLGSYYLRLVVGLFITYYSLRLIHGFIKHRAGKSGKQENDADNDRVYASIPKSIAIGLLSGLVAGLTGTGGGAVNMPLFIGLLGIPVHYAVALSTFTIFPSAVVAAIRHVLNNDVVYSLALPVALGAVVGANIGPRVATKLSPQWLRLFIGLVLLYAGARIILSTLL